MSALTFEGLGYPIYPKPVPLTPTMRGKIGVLATTTSANSTRPYPPRLPAAVEPRRLPRWTGGDKAGGVALIKFLAGGEGGDRAMGDGHQGLERGGCVPTVIQRPSSPKLQYST